MTKTSKTKKVTEVKNNESELEGMKTISSKVRYLASQGKSRAEIAKMLNIRYQHVRNVLVTPLKKGE